MEQSPFADICAIPNQNNPQHFRRVSLATLFFGGGEASASDLFFLKKKKKKKNCVFVDYHQRCQMLLKKCQIAFCQILTSKRECFNKNGDFVPLRALFYCWCLSDGALGFFRKVWQLWLSCFPHCFDDDVLIFVFLQSKEGEKKL